MNIIRKLCYAGILFACPAAGVYAQENNTPAIQQAGYYRMKLGDLEITAVSDGSVPLPVEKLLTNTTKHEVDSLLQRSYQTTTMAASVNAYIIKTPNGLIMVDAGTAELYGPTLGHLSESIRAAGFTPEQITTILITHIHTDHTGGLMEGDRMVFPNATVYISKPEADYWLSEKNAEQAPEGLKKYFTEARTKVLPYVKAGKVKLFEYDKDLFPGITPIPSPGHTPGHTFYAVQSKGEKIMFWGDIMHVAPVQFANPAITIQFDVDPKAAAAARLKAYQDAAKEGYWLAVDHISFPGLGHIREKGKGYEWFPINYTTYGSGQ